MLPEGFTGLFALLNACGTVYEKMESSMVVQLQDLMEELNLLRVMSGLALTDAHNHEYKNLFNFPAKY